MRFVLFLLLFVSNVTLFGQSKSSSRIEVTDLLQIKTSGKPSFSPDGKQALFTMMEIMADSDKKGEFNYITHLYLSDLDSKTYRPLTSGKYSISSPSWSPDGKSILFSRDLGNKSQAYILNLAGGEPVAVTSFVNGISNPIWAKNGKYIYVQTSISARDYMLDSLLNKLRSVPSWSFEKPKLSQNQTLIQSKSNPDGDMNEIRAYLFQNEKEKKAKVINRLNFQEETTTTGEINITLVYQLAIEGKLSPILINNPMDRWAEFEEFNRDYLVIIPADSTLHPDRVLDNQIVSFNPSTKTYQSVIQAKGNRYSNLTLSNQQDWLAFIESKSTGVHNGILKIKSLIDKNATIISVPLDRVITQIKWDENGQRVFLIAQDHGGVPLFVFDLLTKKLNQLTDANAGILGFDYVKNNFIYTKTCIENPSELYTNDLNGKNEQMFTHFNEQWISNKSIIKPVKKTFKNNKGQEIDYWVMKPANFIAGKKYPMLLNIHGGPSAMWGTGEASMWHEFQYFAAKGMGVVYANPRGSGGYGSDFLASNVNDWGAGPMSDVMQALDLTIKDGWVDTSQVAVSGGSYAGYLVTWIVGHTNRFKVACSQRGVYELSNFMGEGNAWRLVPNYFGGYPWEKIPRNTLDRESPLTYVQNIKTPLIIFHGENDLRTGVIGSETLFKSLKILGRDVEYVRHPGASHEITRAGNNRQRIDQMLRTFEFFARYLDFTK